jgi:hypothetical protein
MILDKAWVEFVSRQASQLKLCSSAGPSYLCYCTKFRLIQKRCIADGIS